MLSSVDQSQPAVIENRIFLIPNQNEQIPFSSDEEIIVIPKKSELLMEDEIDPPPLQKLIEHVDHLARYPQIVDPEQLAHLPTQFNDALQTEPCFLLEHYQTRVVQLRKTLKQVEKIAHAKQLATALDQHIIRAKQAAQTLHRESATPVQDSIWQLYDRILHLPTLEPDFFGAAIAELNEKLPYADVSNPLIEQLEELLPQLVPPSHYLWNQGTPYSSGIEELERLKRAILIMRNGLKKVPTGYIRTLSAPMEKIYETYRTFLNEFVNASEIKKKALSIPKAQLSGVGLGFFSIDQEVARTLLSRDGKGRVYKNNALGTHAVHREAGVFYKPNPEGRFYIGPEMEFAIYAFYQLLGSAGTAPATLIKIKHLFFDEQSETYGRTLQAGYGIDGISLQELLGMIEVIPFLQRSLGIEAAQDAFKRLLDQDWEEELLKTHPHLSKEALSSLSVEESANCLIKAFEELLDPLPLDQRCIEFSELSTTNATKCDFYRHISAHSTERLTGTLTLLTHYPQLSHVFSMGKMRSTSLTVELTDLCHYLKKIKRCFPSLSSEQLLQELPQLMNRFDAADFSTHFVVTLLTNPCDHKTDNLMVTWTNNEQGAVESISLVGIDNDLAFAPSVDSVRSILYLLKPMELPFDYSIAQRLLEMTAEGLVLDWLVALEEQNQAYIRWLRRGVLTPEDLFEDNEPSLHIPLELDVELVPTLYNKAKRLIQLLETNSSLTHGELLNAIEPRLAQAYEKALKSSDHAEMAYHQVPLSFDEGEKPSSHAPIKQSPDKAALAFLTGLNLNIFSLEQQVSLIGKALQTFPTCVHHLALPEDSANSVFRRDFFLMAVQQGHLALVARLLEEEKKSRLEKQEELLSLIEVRNEEGQTPLLIACLKLDLQMIRLLIHYRADPQATDAGGRGPLTLCLMRFADAPTQAAAAVRLLGDESAVMWNATGGRLGWGPLYYLVEVALQAPEEAEPLIAYLMKKGANPDLLDNRRNSPLDLAIEQKHERLLEQLIRLGAGRTLNVEAACAFFDARPHLEGVFTLLKSQSLLLRWHLTLEALRNASSESGIFLHGAQLGQINLPPVLTMHLLDDNNNISPQINYGRRNVNKITLPDGQELFFKQYPEMPGVEYAIDTLFELLIGHGTSFTDLAKLKFPNGESYPVLLSQGVQGENLHDVLCDPTKTKQLDKLDPLHFSELFLASLLVNFEDAKPDNFILEPLPKGTYRLVGIDNDHAFVPPLVKSGGETVQVKCILYCLDQMTQPLHPASRERFLSFTPKRLLQLWLNRLLEQNQRYCTLFPEDERIRLFKETKKHPGMVIPIPFKPGTIADIYQKIQRIQIAMKESDELTGMELLRQVIPPLGVRYEEAFKAYNTPLDRFLSLVKTRYSIALAGRLDTLMNSRQTLKSMGIPEKAGWTGAVDQGPNLAIQELEDLQQEIQATNQLLESIRDALQIGNTKPFSSLRLNTVKEKVIQGVPGVFEGIDFKKMQARGQPNLEIQKNVLSAILGGQYRTLTFKGCAVLDKATFNGLLRNSPQLLSLELHDCPKVDQELLIQLSKLNYLTHLRLSSLPQLVEISLSYPSLRRLEIDHCHGLQRLTISDTLRDLSVEACWKLSSIEASLYKAPRFQGRPKLENKTKQDSVLQRLRQKREPAKDFILQRLRLNACPQLQPWWKIFERWLNTSPAHEIQLKNVPPNPSASQLGLVFEAILVHPKANEMMASLDAYCKGEKIGELISLMQHSQANSSTGINLLKYKDFVTDNVLQALLKSCPNLTMFNLEQCKITDVGIETLSKGCPGLTSVTLYACKITNAGVEALSKGCPNLKMLSLEDCDKITDVSLEALSKNCPRLTALNLNNCFRITDTGLTALSKGCPDLTTIGLFQCIKVTDVGLEALSKGCPNLTYLDRTFSRGITDAGIKALREKLPNIRIHNSNINYIGKFETSNPRKSYDTFWTTPEDS